MKSGFAILQSNAKSENGFHFLEIRPRGGFQLRNPNPDFMDFLLYRMIEKSEKEFAKLILLNSGLLFANYACACKTAVLKNSFSNPFSDFPNKRKERKSKRRYPSIEIPFRISRSISNPKSVF